MNDIQKARDVLAKWREDATIGPWHSKQLNYDDDWEIGVSDMIVASGNAWAPGDATLIVGTAGNPDLLDAIDTMLADSKYFQFAALVPFAERIAAAVICADERIQQ